ncbi:MAG TPA: YciI family protein [Terriglobales bacterium]|nr:YciI family protein [Terriglobales bacterium]
MPHYMLAIYHPDDFDPSSESADTIEAIHALNREMIAAGKRKFACGRGPAKDAKTVRRQPDGKVVVTDGPYTETKEHIGGFWVIEAADMDEAIAWARKSAAACRVSAEVWPIFFKPEAKGSKE